MKSKRQAAIARIRGLARRPDWGYALAGALRGCRALELSHDNDGAHRAGCYVHEERRQTLVLAVGPHEYADAQAQKRVAAYR